MSDWQTQVDKLPEDYKGITCEWHAPCSEETESYRRIGSELGHTDISTLLNPPARVLNVPAIHGSPTR
jgi:hypothetical protein